MERKERIFLTLNNQMIMGNQAIINQDDCDNLFIGEYYFNRNTISPNNASLTKLELIDNVTIVEDIYEYNEIVGMRHYEGLISLENYKDNEYFVASLIDRKELFANKYGIAPSNTSSITIK